MNRLPSLFLLLCLVGCATQPEQKVVITNAARKPLTRVEAISGPTRLGAWETFPGSSSQSVVGIPPSLIVAWTDADGKAHRADANLKDHLPTVFSSNLYVQIEPDNRLNIKLGAAKRQAVSDIPWTKPETWEGAPNIPGLDQN